MAPRTSKLQIDAARLLRHVGGVAAYRKKLSLLGYEQVPTEARMRQWVHRSSIPCDALLAIACQAKAEGRPIDITDFVKASAQ